MDIKSPLSGQLSVSGLQNIASRLELKLGQQVEVKLESIQASKNQITLQLANKILQVQSDQAQISKMEPGQLLKLIVSKTSPTVEFILQQTRPEKATPELLSAAKNAGHSPSPTSLKLISLVSDKPITASEAETQPVPDKKTSQTLIDTTKPVLNRLKNATVPDNQSPLQTSRSAVSVSGKTVISSVEIKTNTVIFDKSNPNTLSIEAKAEIFKQLLPKQESPAVAVNQLIKEMPKLLGNNNVSKTLKRLAVQILQSLPQRQQLNSGPALKQSVDNAGLFLEAKLPELAKNLTGKTTNELKLPEELQLTKDLKLNFLKFIQALKQESSAQTETKLSNTELDAIKNLLQKSENVLAKIILDQFNALPKEESPKQVWNLELPFMHQNKAETVQIEFEQEKDSQNQSNEDQWSVNITLTPPNLGTIHCRLNQQNGAINSQFWSKNKKISQLIQANLDYLKQQLEDSGLTVGHINAHTGKPVQTSDKATAGMQLFDEKA